MYGFLLFFLQSWQRRRRSDIGCYSARIWAAFHCIAWEMFEHWRKNNWWVRVWGFSSWSGPVLSPQKIPKRLKNEALQVQVKKAVCWPTPCFLVFSKLVRSWRSSICREMTGISRHVMERCPSGPAYRLPFCSICPCYGERPAYHCLSTQFPPFMARGPSGPAYHCLAALYCARPKRARLACAGNKSPLLDQTKKKPKGHYPAPRTPPPPPTPSWDSETKNHLGGTGLTQALREMAICFATWVSVLLGTSTTSCNVVDRDLSLIRGRRPRAVCWDGRQGVRFGKTGEANPRPRSTSTPSASACSWAWVRVDLRRRGVESGFQSELNWSLASTAYRRRRRLASCLPLAGSIKENGNSNV